MRNNTHIDDTVGAEHEPYVAVIYDEQGNALDMRYLKLDYQANKRPQSPKKGFVSRVLSLANITLVALAFGGVMYNTGKNYAYAERANEHQSCQTEMNEKPDYSYMFTYIRENKKGKMVWEYTEPEGSFKGSIAADFEAFDNGYGDMYAPIKQTDIVNAKGRQIDNFVAAGESVYILATPK